MGNNGSCESSKCAASHDENSGYEIKEEMVDKVMETYWLMYDPEQREIISKIDSKAFTKRVLAQFGKNEIFLDRIHDQVWDRVNQHMGLITKESAFMLVKVYLGLKTPDDATS